MYDKKITREFIRREFAMDVCFLFQHGVKHTKKDIYKLARRHQDKDYYTELSETEIKELYELGMLLAARFASRSGNQFEVICGFYDLQIPLNLRTSNSVALAQFSTPLPISYLAGEFVRRISWHRELFYTRSYLEPTAGNGLLTVALYPNELHVNEIDETRLASLRMTFYGSVPSGERLEYRKITNQDATKPFEKEKYDGIITNPPFGVLDYSVDYDGYKITQLEHLIALRALDAMKSDGHAAIIIGGHTQWDDLGRIKSGKDRAFLSYLYSHYNVIDIININGELYRKQGTTYPIRLILICGRKNTPTGYAPLYDATKDKIVSTFSDLKDRVEDAMEKTYTFRNTTINKNVDLELAEAEAEAVIIELELLKL